MTMSGRRHPREPRHIALDAETLETVSGRKLPHAGEKIVSALRAKNVTKVALGVDLHFMRVCSIFGASHGRNRRFYACRAGWTMMQESASGDLIRQLYSPKRSCVAGSF